MFSLWIFYMIWWNPTTGWSGSWSAASTTYDDSSANLGATDIQWAIDIIDTKTDQVDEVMWVDYNAYVNTKI